MTEAEARDIRIAAERNAQLLSAAGVSVQTVAVAQTPASVVPPPGGDAKKEGN